MDLNPYKIRNLSANIDFDRLRHVCFWFPVRLVSRQKTSVTRARFSLQKVILSFAKGLYEVLHGQPDWKMDTQRRLLVLVASALNGLLSVLTGSEDSGMNALKQHRQYKYLRLPDIFSTFRANVPSDMTSYGCKWCHATCSLPADVLRGSFVTHSFNAWQTNLKGRLRGGYATCVFSSKPKRQGIVGCVNFMRCPRGLWPTG